MNPTALWSSDYTAMTKKQKKQLTSIAISAIILILCKVLPINDTIKLILYTVSYLTVGYKVIISAAKNVLNLSLLDENFLMAIASIGAFCIGEYAEATAVMLFFEIGELFESYAVGKSRGNIAELMDMKPDYANIKQNDTIIKVSPEEVKPDDIITVLPGERVPLDGVIISGSSSLDTSALTGEAIPRNVSLGDEVISGCINLDGMIELKVTKPFSDSTVMRILELVENSASQKAKTERFITKFAKYYTPIVVGCAIALCTVPPAMFSLPFADWLRRSLMFLVVSCPCALVVSVPLSFFGGIGAASKMGILIKGSNYIEVLSKVDTIVTDKTGTLTKGVFKVTEIHSENFTETQLLELAAAAESRSNHPIARSLCEACPSSDNKIKISSLEEIAGKGVKAIIDNKEVLVGNGALMDEFKIKYNPICKTGTVVYIATDGIYQGYILISDELKPNTKQGIDSLKKNGIRNIVMLTGDNKQSAEDIAEKLGITTFFYNLLPEDKVRKTQQIIKEQVKGSKTAFVGDGINDAPVLAVSDIGIAMGAFGSDAAIEAADVVLMNDDITDISKAYKIAKKTLAISKQNIIFALSVKFILLIMSALGYGNMWLAVFADVGVLILAILNSMRTLITSDIK